LGIAATNQTPPRSFLYGATLPEIEEADVYRQHAKDS